MPHLQETEKEISSVDPVSDKFIFIDLINFDLNYLNSQWHLILKSYISQLCSSNTTCCNLKFFKSMNFCKNGKTKTKASIQIYCHNYIILCNFLKQPSNSATRGHFTKHYKYPQNSGKLHHLVSFGESQNSWLSRPHFKQCKKQYVFRPLHTNPHTNRLLS